MNEGFATFMSYEGVHAVRPDWDVWSRFVLDEIHDVLSLDSLKNSHPISVKVNDPNEISELFDHISYAKGASIIRMMTHIIGIETFKEGMHSYLKAFEYSNADQSDLWRHLQAASDKNRKGNEHRVSVKKIMDSWTLKEGYPLITIKRDYQTNKLRFSQQRFLLNANETEKKQLYLTQYEVPISFTYKSEPNWEPVTKLWLHKTNNSTESFAVSESSIPKSDWFIANLQQTGYYRVTYDEKNWELLIDQLLADYTKIHRINRAQILDDLFHLAENGIVKYGLALRALEYFKNETDPLPLTNIGQLTYLINRMLRRTETYGQWQTFLRKVIEPAYRRFELNEVGGENLQDSQMQRSIVNIACAYNLDACVNSSIKLFNEFIANVNKSASFDNHISPNVRPAVYCTGML